jgi:hypothetical protein
VKEKTKIALLSITVVIYFYVVITGLAHKLFPNLLGPLQ